MTEYECEVCGIVHVDDDGNEWTDDTDGYPPCHCRRTYFGALTKPISIDISPTCPVHGTPHGYPSVTGGHHGRGVG